MLTLVSPLASGPSGCINIIYFLDLSYSVLPAWEFTKALYWDHNFFMHADAINLTSADIAFSLLPLHNQEKETTHDYSSENLWQQQTPHIKSFRNMKIIIACHRIFFF